MGVRDRVCTRGWWASSQVLEVKGYLDSVLRYRVWVVLCAARSWTRWSLWVSSNLGYSVILRYEEEGLMLQPCGSYQECWEKNKQTNKNDYPALYVYLYHRVAGVGSDLKDHQVPASPCCRQGCQLLGQVLDHVAQDPIQPGLEHLLE